jgi:uncharacterized integral membrane protein (TIGR00698 family)
VRSELPKIAPGILICVGAALVAQVLHVVESSLFNDAWLDAIVIALVVGFATRSIFGLHERFVPGVAFTSKQLLEFAVMLLGATVTVEGLQALGLNVLVGIVAIVVLSIAATYAISRMFGLPKRQSVLIACGNSICGNSAIAAVSSVIKAKPQETASAIAFTTVLGVIVVLFLPLAYFRGGLGEYEYGILAGLTVYAVPQVLAATVPVGVTSMQVAALVKLVRVAMLGPVVLSVSLVHGMGQGQFRLKSLLPWFLAGFALLAMLRIGGVIPEWSEKPITIAAKFITVISMAAIGFSINISDLKKSALRVSFVVSLSLALLISISVAFILLR